MKVREPPTIEKTESAIRDLPRNLEAEQAVLAAVLLEPERTVPRILETLSSEHFYSRRNRTIFRAIKRLQETGEPVDVISVASHLEDVGDMQQAGGRAYLRKLTDMQLVVESFPHYAKIVRRKSASRSLIDAADILADIGYDEGLEHEEMFSRACSVFESGEDAIRPPSSASSLLSMAELRGVGIPPREDVIEDLLPRGGLIQLLGPPKAGKTMLALNLAVAIARGAEFIGRKTLQGPVLYLSAEGGVGLLEERLSRMIGSEKSLLERIIPWCPTREKPQIRLDSLVDLAWIEDQCVRHKVTALVIDPLALFHEVPENDNDAMKVLVHRFQKLAIRRGIGFVIVHHTRKAGANSRPGSPQEGRGASALHAAVSASLTLAERSGNLGLYTEPRLVEKPPPVQLVLDPSTLRFSVGEVVQHGNQKLTSSRLLEILQRDGPLNYDKLCEATGCSVRTVSGRVGELKADGLVDERRDGRGKQFFAVEAEDRTVS